MTPDCDHDALKCNRHHALQPQTVNKRPMRQRWTVLSVIGGAVFTVLRGFMLQKRGNRNSCVTRRGRSGGRVIWFVAWNIRVLPQTVCSPPPVSDEAAESGIVWSWFVLILSSIWLFQTKNKDQRAGVLFCFVFFPRREPWPINAATAEGQMWAGGVMAALLLLPPPRAGGYRRKNCDRRLQGTRRLMRADRVSLRSTAVSSDRCHILWHSADPANQTCLWRIPNARGKAPSRSSMDPGDSHYASRLMMINPCHAFILLLAATIGGGKENK